MKKNNVVKTMARDKKINTSEDEIHISVGITKNIGNTLNLGFEKRESITRNIKEFPFRKSKIIIENVPEGAYKIKIPLENKRFITIYVYLHFEKLTDDELRMYKEKAKNLIFKEGKDEEAIPWLLKSLELDPCDDEIGGHLARAFYRLKEYDLAIRYTDLYIKHKSKNPVIYLIKGAILRRNKIFKMAEKMLTKGLRYAHLPEYQNKEYNHQTLTDLYLQLFLIAKTKNDFKQFLKLSDQINKDFVSSSKIDAVIISTLKLALNSFIHKRIANLDSESLAALCDALKENNEIELFNEIHLLEEAILKKNTNV